MATGVLKDEISKELDDFISKVEESGTVDQSVLKFIKRVKDNIVKFGFDASGNLMQSIKPLPTSVNGNIVKITIEIEDYWKDLEEGTKPKGYSKEKRSLSYAIATNILKNGTIKRFGYKGKKFLTIEIPQLEKDIAKDYQP